MRLKFVPMLKRHVKTAISLSLFVLFISIGFSACQKGIEQQADGNFTAAAAKEWYYATFKKSSEWATSSEKGKKLPDWKNNIYKKVGNLEIVEFPLIKAKTSFAIPSHMGSNDSEKRKIFNASLSRIVIIKKGSRIVLREVDYVPDWQYLIQKGYDISNISLLTTEIDFSGRVSIKKWNGENISSVKLVNGVVVSRSKPVNKTSGTEYSSANNSLQSCLMEYCIWQRDCTITIYSDGLVQNECGPEYNTGECWIEDTCEPNECQGLTSEECACQMYGVCGDGDGDDEDCTDVPNISNLVSTSEATEAEYIPGQVFNNSGIEKRKDGYSWYFHTVREPLTGSSWRFKSFEETEAEKVNGVWKFTSVTHKSKTRIGTVPHCLKSEVEINSAVGNILNGGSKAKMDLEYALTAGLTCCGVCSDVTESYTQSKEWPCKQ